MIRLALLAAATYAACRMTKAIIDENRERLLLPAPLVRKRSNGPRRSARNG